MNYPEPVGGEGSRDRVCFDFDDTLAPGERFEGAGLAWEAHAAPGHDDEALMPAARELALRMAKMPTRALALTKAALNASLHNDLPAQLEVEARSQKGPSRCCFL